MNVFLVKKINYIDLLAVLLCCLFIIAGSSVSVIRFWQYEVFYYDFGIFDQAIWQVAHFQPPIIDHLVVGNKWIFADHFNPSIFLFSPLYWFTNRSEILLIAQSIIVGLSGIFLYKIGIKTLKNKFLSLSILICYLFFIGLQNAVISDFHEVTVSVLPLMIAFWAILASRKLLYFLSLLIILGFKESIFLVGIGIGVFIFLTKKEWKKISILTILISLAWGIIAIKIIIPYFSGGIYQYIAGTEINNPFITFFDNQVKRRTLFYSFLSFGFLPIFSYNFWFLFLQDFYTRFVPNANTRWDLGLHYSAQLSVFLAIGSLYSLKFLNKHKLISKHLKIISLVLICNTIFIYRFILHGPFGLFYNATFYKHTFEFKFLDKLTGQVAKNSFVMTQNNLAVRFTHQKVMLLKPNYFVYNPDYIVIDIRRGQNPNNFFPISNIESIMEMIRSDKSYQLIYSTSEQFIFKHI